MMISQAHKSKNGPLSAQGIRGGATSTQRVSPAQAGGQYALTILRVACLVLTLTACGFHPLYSKNGATIATTEPAVAEQLRQIKVLSIADRAGQKLQWQLKNSLAQGYEPDRPLYQLAVSLDEAIGYLGIQQDASSAYGKLSITATFSLTESKTGKTLFEDTQKSTSGYTIVDSEYASLKAEQDAREKVLRQLSEQITRRLSLFFNKK
jgi:LPS-assembly lipoprotein